GYRRKGGGVLIRSALPFGASAAFAFAITNADQAVVGVLLHTESLGYFVLALCLASWPIPMFSPQVRDAAPVAFARFRRGPQVMGSAFLSSANLLAAVTLPVCVLLAVLAGPIVQLIYGPAWAPAAPVLAWLAPLATLRVFYALANEYFAVLAPTRRRLVFQLLWLVSLVPALVAGAWWRGILGVAMAEVAVALLFLVPWYLAEVRPRVIWPRLPAMRFAFPLAAAAAVGLIAAGAHRLIPAGHLDLALGVAAATAALGLRLFRLRTVFVAGRPARPGGRHPRAGPRRHDRAAHLPGVRAAAPWAAASGRAGPGQQGSRRGQMERAEHRHRAGLQLHGWRAAGADRVRPLGVGPVRGVPDRARHPAGGQQRHHPVGREHPQLRPHRLHPVGRLEHAHLRGAVHHRPGGRPAPRLAGRHLDAPAAVHMRDHRWPCRRPARADQPGVR